MKVKVQEACASLRIVYEEVPNLREFIHDSMKWFLEAEGHVSKKEPGGDLKKPVKVLPDFDPSEAEPYVPAMTQDQAFREFVKANPTVNDS